MPVYRNRTNRYDLSKIRPGHGVTMLLHTDAHAYTVERVTPTRIIARRDQTTLMNPVGSDAPDALQFSPGGFHGHTYGVQRWTYARDPNGCVATFTKRHTPRGGVLWKLAGHRTDSPGCVLLKGRTEHYDFNY